MFNHADRYETAGNSDSETIYSARAGYRDTLKAAEIYPAAPCAGAANATPDARGATQRKLATASATAINAPTSKLTT